MDTGTPTGTDTPTIVERIPRDFPEYVIEELIAELGNAFLCVITGIDIPEVTKNSAAYIQGWLQVFEADNNERLIFQAAAQAQRAVDYIFGKKVGDYIAAGESIHQK